MASQKWFFLYALIITFIVFNIGIYMGYKLEASRIDTINDMYLEAEMRLLDQRIQKDAWDIVDLNCDLLFEENIIFGDQIYEEALRIEKYESASRIGDEINLLHKKYDLLRTLFWVNSMKIKQKCDLDYHNVVYFYQYNNVPLEKKAKQQFFSNLLFELKQSKGDKIMLIPIAADNDISSIRLFLDEYGVTELPTILIDEEIKITEVENIEDVEKYLG